MKLIVQIPCYNEEQNLPAVIAGIPRQIEGINQIEILVVDDGSTDGTVAAARAAGADHIIRMPGHKGLARTFRTGLDACIHHGADVIVNIDGDNQHPQEQIPDLVAPIVANRADMVIGVRELRNVEHFSPIKKLLQRLGSWIVRRASGTDVPDATSGFRALSREAALHMALLSGYSYTLETIIQAGKKSLRIQSVPVHARPATRDSRLIRSTTHFIRRQAATVFRLYVFYEPLRTFCYLSAPFLLVGALALGRFFYFVLIGETGPGRHLQSIVIGTTSLILGFILLVMGILAQLMAGTRMQTEEVLYRVKRLEAGMSGNVRQPTHVEQLEQSSV